MRGLFCSASSVYFAANASVWLGVDALFYKRENTLNIAHMYVSAWIRIFSCVRSCRRWFAVPTYTYTHKQMTACAAAAKSSQVLRRSIKEYPHVYIRTLNEMNFAAVAAWMFFFCFSSVDAEVVVGSELFLSCVRLSRVTSTYILCIVESCCLRLMRDFEIRNIANNIDAVTHHNSKFEGKTRTAQTFKVWWLSETTYLVNGIFMSISRMKSGTYGRVWRT